MTHILRCHEITKTDFVRGEGCALYDAQGRRYLDLESGTWCACLGHSHPRIADVIARHAAQLTHLGLRYPNDLAEEAAARALELLGMDGGACTFLSSGSEAVELGARVARQVTGRSLLLSFSDSYLAAYGSAGGREEGGWWLLDPQAGAGMPLSDRLGSVPFDHLAGFVLEPGGSGSAFVRFPDPRLVEAIATRVQQAGGLLVVDEVTTGLGRTGEWFGYQHVDVRPDIVALGKGLGNGYPISAVAMTGDVAARLQASGLHYVQSHQNDPLGCAVATEVIAVIAEDGLVARARDLGAHFLDGLTRLAATRPGVQEARGRGLLLGLELQPHAARTAAWVYRELLRRGYLVGYHPAGHLVRFDPPLTIAVEEVDGLLECLADILAAPLRIRQA